MLTLKSSHFLFHRHSEGGWSYLKRYYRNIVVKEKILLMYMCLPVGIASVVGGAVINSVVGGGAVVTGNPVVVAIIYRWH